MRGLYPGEADYADGNPYRERGDCPVEGILTAGFAPEASAIPAYPVHQHLAHWTGRGCQFSLGADGAIQFEAPADLHAGVRGMVNAIYRSEHLLHASRLWITSYQDAPEGVRWRWAARDPRSSKLPPLKAWEGRPIEVRSC